MYEKTIAREFRVYNITATATATKVYDLLSAPDKLDLNNILNDESRKAIVVDGSLTGDADILISHSSSGATQTVTSGTPLSLPIYDWVNKVYVKNAATVSVLVYIS
jgi:hypothetical protein